MPAVPPDAFSAEPNLALGRTLTLSSAARLAAPGEFAPPTEKEQQPWLQVVLEPEHNAPVFVHEVALRLNKCAGGGTRRRVTLRLYSLENQTIEFPTCYSESTTEVESQTGVTFHFFPQQACRFMRVELAAAGDTSDADNAESSQIGRGRTQ
jgi:hypothetical protein